MITKDKMPRYLDKFSLLVPYEMYREKGLAFLYRSLKGSEVQGFRYDFMVFHKIIC